MPRFVPPNVPVYTNRRVDTPSTGTMHHHDRSGARVRTGCSTTSMPTTSYEPGPPCSLPVQRSQPTRAGVSAPLAMSSGLTRLLLAHERPDREPIYERPVLGSPLFRRLVVPHQPGRGLHQRRSAWLRTRLRSRSKRGAWKTMRSAARRVTRRSAVGSLPGDGAPGNPGWTSGTQLPRFNRSDALEPRSHEVRGLVLILSAERGTRT